MFPIQKQLLAATLIFLLAAPVANAKPRHTAAQARQIAAAFCRKIGVAVPEQGQSGPFHVGKMIGKNGEEGWIEFLEATPGVAAADWKVDFTNDIEVNVLDQTGAITDFHNSSSLKRLSSQPIGRSLPQEEIINRATAVMNAAGAPFSEMAFERAEETPSKRWKMRDYEQASEHAWSVEWRRVYKGIPYHNQRLMVRVQAETGEVIDAATRFSLVPPTSVKVAISRDQAIRTAQAQLDAAGILEMPFRAIQKEIVQPNDFWLGTYPNAHKPLRLVWLCQFAAPLAGADVWVDAQTGDVIGGQLSDDLVGFALRNHTLSLGRQLKAQRPLAPVHDTRG